jgi:subtilisin family serine protease
MKTRLLLTLIHVVFSLTCTAQDKYWVFFNDKEDPEPGQKFVSEQTYHNRTLLGYQLAQYSDYPVKQKYIEAIERYANVTIASKWLNAVSVKLNHDDVHTIGMLPFVTKIVRMDCLIRLASIQGLTEPQKTVEAVRQIHAEEFLKAGLTGKNVAVGVIDGGFIKANHTPSLMAAFNSDRIKAVRDFVVHRSNIFEDVISENDGHGTAVMQMISGEDKRVRFGVAQSVDFYLARTDHGKYEFRGEEDHWIAALEWLDSLGVRLVNSSLGYSVDYDIQDENHAPHEANGATAAITKAAKIAVEEKGMILVNSAGNDGGSEHWNVVNLPADAEGVITVGATDWQGLKREYSSIGPRFNKYVKPDLACYSDGGTSLAAPVVTGIIACMLQKKPGLTSAEIKRILKVSSSLYPFCNNYIGYGVPDARSILSELSNIKQAKQRSIKEVVAQGDHFSIAVSAETAAAIYHKESDIHVVSQEYKSAENKVIAISRPAGAIKTTVLLPEYIFEISWK